MTARKRDGYGYTIGDQDVTRTRRDAMQEAEHWKAPCECGHTRVYHEKRDGIGRCGMLDPPCACPKFRPS